MRNELKGTSMRETSHNCTGDEARLLAGTQTHAQTNNQLIKLSFSCILLCTFPLHLNSVCRLRLTNLRTCALILTTIPHFQKQCTPS